VEQHAAHLGSLYARFSAVAAGNPDAWDRTAHTADEIARPSAGNRMVGAPYTKLLCSNEMVDQAAGVILCSAGTARALGIPLDRWVFPIAAVEAKAPYVSERMDLSSSPMIRLAGERLRAITGIGPDDIAHVDLYSCFPSAVQVQAAELGFDLVRDLTVTGGMRFFGGPWNNYTMHAVVSMIDRLRNDPTAFGLCTSNGGLLTKQVTSLFSAAAPTADCRLDSVQDEVDALPRRDVDPSPSGPAEVETYTVMYDREGPTRGIVAACLADGRRGWGVVTEPEGLAAMTEDDPLGRPLHLRDGTAVFD
jgi:acetyl-CoA C-acetyltransferase